MEIKKIFVVGAGFMGSGIAQNAITSGFEVILNDMSMEILEKAKSNIDKMLSKNVTKGRMTEEEKELAMGRLHLSEKIEAVVEADMVIEAIIEKVEAKKAKFIEINKYCREDAILASNTSSISIAELSSVVNNPNNFIGLHFFSPVPLMKLLEIVKAITTSKETVEIAKKVGEKLGKICIVSKDSPGFIVNRMLDPMINEAIGLLEAGIGSVEDIDNGMKYGCNHPMGPLELIDMAGIDIELAVMEVLYNETGDPKYRPSTLLKNMVRAKYLGRKTGIGFYIYDENGGKTPNTNLLQ